MLRLAKRGESIMSLNGSPISIAQKRTIAGNARNSMAVISIPLANGKMIELEGTNNIDGFKRGMNKRDKKRAVNELANMQAQLSQLMASLQDGL